MAGCSRAGSPRARLDASPGRSPVPPPARVPTMAVVAARRQPAVQTEAACRRTTLLTVALPASEPAAEPLRMVRGLAPAPLARQPLPPRLRALHPLRTRAALRSASC